MAVEEIETEACRVLTQAAEDATSLLGVVGKGSGIGPRSSMPKADAAEHRAARCSDVSAMP